MLYVLSEEIFFKHQTQAVVHRQMQFLYLESRSLRHTDAYISRLGQLRLLGTGEADYLHAASLCHSDGIEYVSAVARRADAEEHIPRTP